MLLLGAFAIAAGSMACIKTVETLDTEDETDSAT